LRILGIDPGRTTGYCFAHLLNVSDELNSPVLLIDPRQHMDDVDDLWDRIAEFKPRYIICEDFEFRNKARAGLVLFSVQLIGITRLYELKGAPLLKHQCAVTLQKAAQGKGYYSDLLLKQIGVYKRGVPHGMDATRHLLHWMTFGAGYSMIQGLDIGKLVKLA